MLIPPLRQSLKHIGLQRWLPNSLFFLSSQYWARQIWLQTKHLLTDPLDPTTPVEGGRTWRLGSSQRDNSRIVGRLSLTGFWKGCP